MENEANGLADSFVARHTTDPALLLELLSRDQNSSRHDQGTEIGAEIFGSLFALFPQNVRSWNVESLETTSNSPLALVQGVARATVQMERVQLRIDQDRRETEIRIRRNREMRERERREIRRSSGWRERQEAVPGPWCSCSLDEFEGHTICRRCGRQRYLERNSVVTSAEESFDQRSGQSVGSVTDRSYGSSQLGLERRVEEACSIVERVSREREREEFAWEIERKEQGIRGKRAREKRERETRELPEESMWPQQPYPARLGNFSEQSEENLTGEGSGRQRILMDHPLHHDISKCNLRLNKQIQGNSKCCSELGRDECCICLEDAFSGYQILPCSHKVHGECVIAVIQNGVRSCPICRQPLFDSPEYTSRQTGNHN